MQVLPDRGLINELLRSNFSACTFGTSASTHYHFPDPKYSLVFCCLPSTPLPGSLSALEVGWGKPAESTVVNKAGALHFILKIDLSYPLSIAQLMFNKLVHI